jgi:DNA modification methylase
MPDEAPIPTGRIVSDARQTLAMLPDRSIGLIITDPPWKIHAGARFLACASYPLLTVAEAANVLADARRVLVRGGHLYCFATTGAEILEVMQTFQSHGWKLLRVLAWDKGSFGGMMGAYRNAWEAVLIFSNGASRGFERHLHFSSLLRARAIARRTAKPSELYEVFMEMSSRPGELVLDPFCGTNPLQRAAERLQPARRWLAGDLLSPEAIAEQLQRKRRQPEAPT